MRYWSRAMEIQWAISVSTFTLTQKKTLGQLRESAQAKHSMTEAPSIGLVETHYKTQHWKVLRQLAERQKVSAFFELRMNQLKIWATMVDVLEMPINHWMVRSWM